MIDCQHGVKYATVDLQVAFTQSELDELHTKVDLRLSKPSHSQAVPVANEDAQAAFEKLAGICVSKGMD
jgi:hypothetical protein